MEQILEEELGMLSASYLERMSKEMLLSKMAAVGVSTPNDKMEKAPRGLRSNSHLLVSLMVKG